MYNKYFLLLTSLLIFLFSSCARVSDSDTLAMVGAERISVGELRDSLNRQKGILPPEKFEQRSEFAKLKEKTLEDLIHKRLMVQKAEEQGFVVSEAELEQEVSKYKSGYSEKDFQAMLAKRGIDYHVWKAIKKENLLVAKFLNSGVLGDVVVTEEEIKHYYEQHDQEWNVSESVHIRQIVTDTQEKAQNIHDRLMKGENFASLASNLSISPEKKTGGDLGFIPKGTFPKVYDVCFTMKPGEISPIIPSSYGFHVFKVIAFRPATRKSLAEVAPKIKQQLELEKREQKFKDYVLKVRQENKVVIFQNILKKVTL